MPAGASVAPAPPGGDEVLTRSRQLGRDVAITTLAQIAIAVGGLLLYRLLALKKGADGVAAYSLVKQTVVFVWPFVLLGMQTAIPRYVALGRDRSGAGEGYLLAALALTGATTALVSILAVVSPPTTASLLFGDADRTELVFPLVATLVATVTLEVMYGYYRGHSKFVLSNAVRISTVAVFPVILLIVAADRSVGALISLMAAAVLACSALAVVGPLLRAIRRASIRTARSAARTLLDFGYRRIPGDLASVVLFAVPPILAAHFVSFHRVAFVSAGLYVMAMISVAFQPVGMVFLPLLTRLVATDFDAARRYVSVLATSAIHVAIFVTPQLVLFAPDAVRAWLGSDFDDAGTVIAILAAPGGFFVFNVVLRSALDAAAVTAYNSRNNVIALAVAALAATVSLATDLANPLNCIAWSFALGVVCLGILTLLFVIRVFRLHPREFALPLAVALGTVTAVVAWLVDLELLRGDASLRDVLFIGGLELALGAVFVKGLVRGGVAWPSEFRNRLLGRGSDDSHPAGA